MSNSDSSVQGFDADNLFFGGPRPGGIFVVTSGVELQQFRTWLAEDKGRLVGRIIPLKPTQQGEGQIFTGFFYAPLPALQTKLLGKMNRQQAVETLNAQIKARKIIRIGENTWPLLALYATAAEKSWTVAKLKEKISDLKSQNPAAPNKPMDIDPDLPLKRTEEGGKRQPPTSGRPIFGPDESKDDSGYGLADSGEFGSPGDSGSGGSPVKDPKRKPPGPAPLAAKAVPELQRTA